MAAAGRSPVCHITARTSDNQCALHGQHEKRPSPEASRSVADSQPSPISARELAKVQQQQQQQEQRQKRSRKPKPPVASWPIGRQTMAGQQALSFGDSESLTSGQLSARLRQPQADQSATCLGPQNQYNHKRPFAQTFEQPSAGWILNAIKSPSELNSVPSGFPTGK